MTSKEIINRIIEHNNPPRIGLQFFGQNPNDFIENNVVKLKYNFPQEYQTWGYHKELLKEIPNFRGEVMKNAYGDILGRLEGKTKGECVKGVLQGGWHLLDDYEFPEFDEDFDKELLSLDYKNSDRFVIGYLPMAIFSRLRDSRLMENALVDTALEPENVIRLMEKEAEYLKKAIRKAKGFGFDAVMIADDLGTQTSMFFSPKTFRELFKEYYRQIAEEAHTNGMKFFMHSCGFIDYVIEDLIEIKVDVLQFDQPELYGSEYLAKKYGDRITFYCPVDIQKVMNTGNKEYIQKTALNMVNVFKSNCNGSLIVKDYPTWWDLDIKEEWAQWARDIATSNAYFS